MDLVTGIIARGQESGELRRGFPPELAAASLVSTWSTITAWWSENTEADADRVNAQFLDIALNGLKQAE